VIYVGVSNATEKRTLMRRVFFEELIPTCTLLVERVGPEGVNNFAYSSHIQVGRVRSGQVGPGRDCKRAGLTIYQITSMCHISTRL